MSEAPRPVYHVVRAGEEVLVPLADDEMPAGPGGRFDNALSAESLARIRRVIEVATSLDAPTVTKELLAAAGAASDPKGGLAALRVLDLEGTVHATTGGRRQLVWHPGPRPEGAEVPRLADSGRYGWLRDVLVAADRWLSTDYLIVEAGFDLDLLAERPVVSLARVDRDLPKSFFWDYGKSARKYVLGALKAFYWLETVAWRCYTRQAIDWRWVGTKPAGSRRREEVAADDRRLPPVPDPYLVADDAEPFVPRAKRLAEAAEQRMDARRLEREKWIEEHHPAAAIDYRAGLREAARSERTAREEAKRWSQPPEPLVTPRPKRRSSR